MGVKGAGEEGTSCYLMPSYPTSCFIYLHRDHGNQKLHDVLVSRLPPHPRTWAPREHQQILFSAESPVPRTAPDTASVHIH